MILYLYSFICILWWSRRQTKTGEWVTHRRSRYDTKKARLCFALLCFGRSFWATSARVRSGAFVSKAGYLMGCCLFSNACSSEWGICWSTFCLLYFNECFIPSLLKCVNKRGRGRESINQSINQNPSFNHSRVLNSARTVGTYRVGPRRIHKQREGAKFDSATRSTKAVFTCKSGEVKVHYYGKRGGSKREMRRMKVSP